MKLINNSKSQFLTSEGPFPIRSIIDFKGEEARTLLKYKGIIRVSDLEIKTIKGKEAELEAEEKAKKAAELEAKKAAELEAKKEAEEKAKEKAELDAEIDAEIEAEEKAKKEAAEEAKKEAKKKD